MSMHSACIILGAVAVTTLELTRQIQQLPAQHCVQAVCVLSGEKPETYWTHADTEHVWSELCCGPFHEAAAAPSCDTVRLTVRLASFFPNSAGLVLVLMEAPWKNGTRESGARMISNEVQSVFFLIQGYKPTVQIGQYRQHPEGMPTCRPYPGSD